jgi:hypothetical protein
MPADSPKRDGLQLVMRQMIGRSFPELRRLRIDIDFEDLDPADCFQCYICQGRFRIGVSRLLRHVPRQVLEGGLAHELVHIARDIRFGPFQRSLAWKRIGASRSYRLREERATDSLAVERGYGPQLIELIRFAGRLGIRFYRENGLLRNEIARLDRSLRTR